MNDEEKKCNNGDMENVEWESYELHVPPEMAGQRIDIVMAELIGRDEISRTRTQFMLKEGFTRLNGKLCTLPRYYVAANDVINVEAPSEHIPLRAEPEQIPLDILYEDEAVLVVNKPAGMVVHPAAGNHSGTLVNAVLGYDSDMADEDFENPLRPGIVHRLDKDTTGCLVIAKTPKALRKLAKSFADRDVEKIYLAFTFGTPVPAAAVLKNYMGRHPQDRIKMAILREGDRNAKEAVTAYRTLESGVWKGIPVSLLQIRLHTGRTHQIRVHMSYKGFPLLGDKLYGKGRQSPAERQMLHAWKLSFPHPVTGETLSFEAPIPDDFRAVMDEMEVKR